MNKKINIAVVGGGNMGAAIISRIKNQYLISVCEKDSARQKFLKSKYKVKIGDLKSVVVNASIIILAVKPQDFDSILGELSLIVTSKHLVISIAAGITTQYIEKRLKKVRVIRTMPNLPAQIGISMTGICKGKSASSADLKLAQNIFNSIGQTILVSEEQINAITAISGSGPAYVFLFVECFIKAAQSLGFNLQESILLVSETIKGSLELLDQSGEMPANLRARVTSKGGTTQAALDAFFKHKFENIFNQAVKAAKQRAKELAK